MLLLFRDIEPVLEQDDAVVDQEVLKDGTAFEKLLVLLLGAEPHDMLDPGAVVPTAIENDDFSARGQLLDVTLGIDLRLLALCGSWQGDQTEHTRAHPFQDALDDATLARCVSALKNDDDARASLLHPILQLHQFDLQLE